MNKNRCCNCMKSIYQDLISCNTCANGLCEDCFEIINSINAEYFVNRFKSDKPEIYEQELEEIKEYWNKYYNMLYDDKEDNDINNFFFCIKYSNIYDYLQCNKCIELEKLKSKIKKLEKDYNELKLFSLYDKKLNRDIIREITKFF